MMPTSFARQLSTLLLISTSLSACAKPAANSKDLDALLPPEPSLPSQVCTELKAQQTAIKGVLPDAVDHDPANSSPDSARLQEEEARHANARDGMRASFDMMVDLLKKQGIGYDQFVLSL